MKIKMTDALATFWVSDVERCGVILAKENIIELENIAEKPQLDFEVSDANFDKYKKSMKATWHTHPSCNANLSLADYEFFKSQPNINHFIICKNYVVCYKMTNGSLRIKQVHSHGSD
jgi:proteasome lid subunit RPN8/RPN11